MTQTKYRKLCRMDPAAVQCKCRDCTANQPTPVTESRNRSNEVSFEIEQVSFEEQDEPVEQTIVNQILSELVDTALLPVTFHFVEDGSQKGRRKVVESTSYSYVIKQCRGGTTYWKRSVRNRNVKCPATLIQKGDTYTRGEKDHVHPALPDLFTTSKVTTEVKGLAKANVFVAASTLVQGVMTEEVDMCAPLPSLPAPANLIRTANRARQRMRPAEPTDLDFEIAEDFIPTNFSQHDVRVAGFRHLIFYTRDQLSLLETSKTWYMDATFKVVDAPFTQLFSLHAFVKSGSNMKHVPLRFALMSKKRQQDYKEIFRCVRDRMSAHFTLKSADFEAGMWQGFRAIFPEVCIRGCSFHWSQAVFRRIQKLGLETVYNKQDATRRLLRKVLSLPFLPGAHIRPAFQELRSFASTPALLSLMAYIQETWMESTVWHIKSWSVFGLAIRTNNDMEGWHRRLNHCATRPRGSS